MFMQRWLHTILLVTSPFSAINLPTEVERDAGYFRCEGGVTDFVFLGVVLVLRLDFAGVIIFGSGLGTVDKLDCRVAGRASGREGV